MIIISLWKMSLEQLIWFGFRLCAIFGIIQVHEENQTFLLGCMSHARETPAPEISVLDFE